MKKKNSLLEFTLQRSQLLVQAFRKAWKESDGTPNVLQLSHKVVLMPAPRFWVSEERATEVISTWLRQGEEFALEGMREVKKRMFREIMRRVQPRLSAGRPLYHVVSEVVNEPAPEQFMTPGNAVFIYYRSSRA